MKQSNLHVAIIMDGNGRWATSRGLPRIAGHRAGAEALRRIVEAAPDSGIRVLTVYAFSSDNWKRPQPALKVGEAAVGQEPGVERLPLVALRHSFQARKKLRLMRRKRTCCEQFSMACAALR